MLLSELVATSAAVASTRSRSAKTAALADTLRRLDPDEIEPAVGYLAGRVRQGRIGIGWAQLGALTDRAPASVPTLTVADLDTTLTEIDGLRGPGSTAARQARLTRLFEAATAEEADWLRRLLLGDVRQGALEGIVVDALAKAADVRADIVRRALMLTGDLPRTARLARTEGEAGLCAVGLTVGRPVLPMLAATAASVADAIADCGRSSVEWKLDGVRIQAHRDGDEVHLFTRNLNEVTDRLPAVVAAVRSLPADRLVLDGELLGTSGDGERPELFQSTVATFARHRGERPGLALWFFDCLHVDGVDLLDAPLVERAAALDRVAGPWRISSVVTDDADVAAAFLDDALAAGHEGVLVKAVDSPYEAGRRGQAWRKVKPVRTLDLVVLAAEWGHGRRHGWLSNLHLGARDPADPERFVMVGKTFKGLTDELLTWQTAEFLARETGRTGIVVQVRPELVVEVALDGVQRSPRYPGGVALRFARVRRYRPDKSPLDADTIDAVRALLPGTGAGATASG